MNSPVKRNPIQRSLPPGQQTIQAGFATAIANGAKVNSGTPLTTFSSLPANQTPKPPPVKNRVGRPTTVGKAQRKTRGKLSKAQTPVAAAAVQHQLIFCAHLVCNHWIRAMHHDVT